MDILQISVIAIVGIVTAIVLKGYKPEFSIFIIIALSFFLAAKGIGILSEVKAELELIQSFYQENQYYYRILFKIVGITYLCEFTSGICKDAGYQSVSGQVELLGKMLILVSGMPVLLAIVETLWKYEL
ncbi:MAG: stage III sporulation AC/AD family protein [Lachnospiraceae bacterium]|nr:stage III sporulation AC/AD family protein [Lachnospiraceae bacterium]MDD7026233.1 SpoIIIAC/SpoIIIAD family protein [Lachnospiraceae bacterium]MDY5701455.1 SpoIIIAC/SpoIIIAD family protein [Lachnospiraceae bacterium]